MGRERVVEKVAETAGMVVESEAAFAGLMDAIEHAPAARLAALAVVRLGVITGEGPTTKGRVHYSRSIDVVDTGLVKRILLAGGAEPISRAEADALFDIHDAACERLDDGAFADLFVKAVAHHVLAASGYRTPERANAIACAGSLADWAPQTTVHGEAAAWLGARLSRKSRGSAAALAALIGTGTFRGSVAGVLDLAA
jgi:hypothetical protein